MMTYAQVVNKYLPESHQNTLENNLNLTSVSTRPSSIPPRGPAWNPPQAPKAYRTNNQPRVVHGPSSMPSRVSQAPEQHTNMLLAHRSYPAVRRHKAQDMQTYRSSPEKPTSPKSLTSPTKTTSTFEPEKVYGLDALLRPVTKERSFREFDSGPEETGSKTDHQDLRYRFSQWNDTNLEGTSCSHDKLQVGLETERHSYTVEFGPACQHPTDWVHGYKLERLLLTFGSFPPLELWKIKA